MSRCTGVLRDSIGTQQTFCDSQGQIECFAAVSVMLPRHAVVCLLVRVMQSLLFYYRSVFVWLPWSVVAWQQVFAQVRSCACYAGSWSSIVPTFCCTDDLQDTRYFMELICSVPAEPLPMQILALASNAGKANQVSSCKLAVADSDGSKAHKLWTCGALVRPFRCVMQLQDAQMTYAALANHRQPHLDCLAYLSQLVLYQINVSKLPLLALIYQNNMSWRSYRMFFRDPSMATSKQTYYDLSTMLLKVAATMPDTLVKTKVCCCHTMVVQSDSILKMFCSLYGCWYE